MSVFGSHLKDRSAYVFAGEPLILQSGNYNCFLQKSIEQTKELVDIQAILCNSAHEIIYAQFTSYFKSNPKLNEAERKKAIEDYYSFCGFGKINLRGLLTKGGSVETQYEHYAVTWKDKYGNRNDNESGVGFFTLGFLCGAVEAIYDIPLGTFSGKQSKCLTKGDDTCRFEIFRGLKMKLHASPGEGVYQRFENLAAATGGSVDYEAIQTALLGAKMEGSHESGFIDAFGGSLTRHYANYYCLVSIRVLIELEKKHGKAGLQKAKALMVESGRKCAFDLVDRIMNSKEGESHFKPMINSQDDWLHACIAVANTMGWGKWEVGTLDSQGESVFNIVSGYESNAFLKVVGKAKAPICYFLEGCISGIMNIVYHTDLSQKPELNDELYNTVFSNGGAFEAEQTTYRMMGADEDTITVKRS